MRILLDESLPIELRDELPQHAVRSVQDRFRLPGGEGVLWISSLLESKNGN